MAQPGPPGYSICNLARTLAPTITASAEDPEFPARNLTDNRAGTVAKLNFTTGSWRLEFASAPTVSLAAILYHGLPSDAVVSIRSGTTGSTPTVRGTFDLTDCIADGDGEAWLEFAPVSTDRFWRVIVTAAGTTAYNVRVGELWLGALTTLSRPAKWGMTESRDYGVQGVTTETGITTSYSMSDRRSWAMEMRDYMTQAQRIELERMARGFRGGGSLGLFVPDTTIANRVVLGRWNEKGYRKSIDLIDSASDQRVSGLGVHIIEDGFTRVNPRS